MSAYRLPGLCARCLGETARPAVVARDAVRLQRRGLAKHLPLGPKKTKLLRVAIVGAGPAGFYAASRLLARVSECRVDMYEKLPTPFGLVRYGVAPDHPEVKSCEEKFTEVAESDRFTFIGNIDIGTQLRLGTLKQHYDAIIFSYGAPHDKDSGIANAHLKGVYSARSFVGWYNGLPEHRDLGIDLSSTDEAVIIGNGKVAMDVARILLTDVDELRKTDIAEHAIEQLKNSRVKKVRVIGRRGLMQASFTIKEVRELIRLRGVQFQPIPPSHFPSPDILKSLDRAPKRLVELLASSSRAPAVEGADKSVSLEFLLQPLAFEDHPTHPDGRVHRTTVQLMQLFPSTAHVKSGRTRSITYPTHSDALDAATNDASVLKTPAAFDSPADIPFTTPTPTPPPQWTHNLSLATPLVFTSTGYTSLPLPHAHADLRLPFSPAGHFPHDGHGRILSHDPTHPPPNSRADPQPLPGLYCAGWAKTGPRGVIATTMADAFETAEAVAADWAGGRLGLWFAPRGGWEGVRGVVGGGGRWVGWGGWRRIDEVERERGGGKKVREKIVSVEEMLRVAGR